MKIMVGYHGEEVGRQALLEARDFAKATGSYVYIVTSMEGGDSETPSEIREAEAGLQFAAGIMKKSGVAFETVKSVRGFSPGEDLVKFAEEHDIDHIFVGLKKISRTHKALLGSTARFVILKAHCPVTSVKFELEKINNFKLLKERRVLVVDDEPDIVETVEELLDMCHLDTAGTYTEAEKLISKNLYDIAILDIMGVSGYDILAMARDRDIPAVILTAHALTPHNLKESIEKGADSYIPKDELANLTDHVADAVRARIQGREGYGVWFRNLKPFFDKAFGKGWRDKDRPFWNTFDDKYKQ